MKRNSFLHENNLFVCSFFSGYNLLFVYKKIVK